MACDERIILDPAEVADAERSELDITQFIDQEGPDWGDAAVSAFLSETRWGDVPVDYRVPSREASIPLSLTDRGTITAETMRSQIQAKVGLFQSKGGWLKRITAAGGTVFADVTNAAAHLTSASGVMSSKGYDPDASLTLSLLPDWYGNEVTLPDHSTTTASELIWTDTNIQGDWPAGNRMRMVIDEDQGVDQTSLIYGFRSWSFDGDLYKEAEAFTTKAGTAVAETGASGGTVVQKLTTTSWASIVSDGFNLEGHYRVFGRFRHQGTADVGQARWGANTNNISYQYNDPVTILGGGSFSLLDLGEMDARAAPVGNLLWFGAVQVTGSAGGENVQTDKIWFVPADEYSGVVREYALDASQSSQLRTEGFYEGFNGGYYFERPIYGDLPRLPIPPNGTAGTIQVFLKASRGAIGDAHGNDATSDSAIDDISARITYRPCWSFVP